MPRGIRQRRQQQQGQLLHSSFAHTDRVFRPTDLRRTAPAAPADARPAAAEALTRAVRSRRPDGESNGPHPGAWTPPPPTCRSARPSRSTESCARTGWSSRSSPPTYLTAVGLKAAGVEIANATFAARRETVWSQGTTTVASDSTHFKAWDRNIFTEWHSRYGGRGVLVYRHIEKGSRAIHSQLLNCTASEVAAAIEGMMRHATTMQAEGNYVDSHGQSEIGFGLTRLLGYGLLPRIKQINKVKLYRPGREDEDSYERLTDAMTRPIRWDVIENNYDQLIKYATAIRAGTASTEAILRRFTRTASPEAAMDALAKDIAEIRYPLGNETT
ncbi:Tn3 family transposase [Streptomyces europaeiscabiei]|uniref:Tn3 family transposase n=1 Tax=Streptomyces europaeiscabiei TaxID=146819 RepID=A0ABU4NHB6_9ACTN|nr:Tn3 family transposase [Streptomyces europaeiscabiei]MDX3544705.1 Tn3 family transposase [Streptomyces europaeiscabiei]MDX3554055.1 Tn3 family transposase [Streptomyces europaeiscabiei]MDX3702173.1 Tn3 family transposase [Streptomyces europaeiscabiei]